MALLEIRVNTPAREALVDITSQVQRAIQEKHPQLSGMVYIFVPHTTAGVTINEGADPAVARDLIHTLARLVPRVGDYHHHEGNADAHVKTALVGSHTAVPVEGGRLRLGTWQSVYLAEFDGPRTRKVWLVPLPFSAPPSSIS